MHMQLVIYTFAYFEYISRAYIGKVHYAAFYFYIFLLYQSAYTER